MPVRPLALLALFLLSTVIGRARATEPLVVDLSKHLVAITTGFTGSDVLLFGATDGEPDTQVVIVVHGPREDVVVRKKDRVAGIWVNREAVTFADAPSFYQVAATDSLDVWLPLPVRERHQIGVEYLRYKPSDSDVSAALETDFRIALVRNKQRAGLYSRIPGRIVRRGERLFRTTVHFPANVPTGTYNIETLLIRDGEVFSAQTTPLFINKTGVGAEIFRLANTQAGIYGVAAIIIALAAGLGANWVFSKV